MPNYCNLKKRKGKKNKSSLYKDIKITNRNIKFESTNWSCDFSFTYQ